MPYFMLIQLYQKTKVSKKSEKKLYVNFRGRSYIILFIKKFVTKSMWQALTVQKIRLTEITFSHVDSSCCNYI